MKTRDSEPRPHRLSISALTQTRCRSPTPSSPRQRGSCRAGPLLRRGLRGLGSLLCVGLACSEPHSLPSLSLRPGSSWMSCSLLPKLAGSSRSRASQAYVVPFPAVCFSYTWALGGLGLAGFSVCFRVPFQWLRGHCHTALCCTHLPGRSAEPGCTGDSPGLPGSFSRPHFQKLLWAPLQPLLPSSHIPPPPLVRLVTLVPPR